MDICTSCLFRLIFHHSVHVVFLIVQGVQFFAQLWNSLHMFCELDNLFLQVRVQLTLLLYFSLQSDSLLFQFL